MTSMYARSGPGPHRCPESIPQAPHDLEYDDAAGFWYCMWERGAEQAREYREQLAREAQDDAKHSLYASIQLGIDAEEEWEGPSIKPGTLTDEQVCWLASWLAGEGFRKGEEQA